MIAEFFESIAEYCAELELFSPASTALDFLSDVVGTHRHRSAKCGAEYRYQKWLQHAIYLAKVLFRIWHWSEQLELHLALLAGYFGVTLPSVEIILVVVIFVCVIEWLEWRRRNM